jgi:integrase
MAKRENWSKAVEAHGIRVRLYQGTRGHIGRAVVVGRTTSANGKDRPVEDRKSLGHSDRELAETQARQLCAAIAEQRLTGTSPDTLTLGQLFTAYRQHHLPTLSPARQKEAQARMAMFSEAWGRDLKVADIDASRVKAYCQKRRTLEVVAPAFKLNEEGKAGKGYRKPQPIRDGALDGEFRWLNSALNFACDHRTEGRPLLTRNPLPTRPQSRRKMGWPVEKNPRRPVASHQRYDATQAHTDAVDGAGRLRCILALARFTGRRESAICAIRASDLLLSTERILAALAAAGANEGLAQHMPHGAIRWRSEDDKQGLLFISPISRPAREALDAYLRQNPRMGDVPLFPAPGLKRKEGEKPRTEKPISRDLASSWLVQAETLAELPKLVGGVFHPYRRLWAMERKSLPAVDVASAGGWGDTQALTRIYQHADPAGVLAAVNGG